MRIERHVLHVSNIIWRWPSIVDAYSSAGSTRALLGSWLRGRGIQSILNQPRHHVLLILDCIFSLGYRALICWSDMLLCEHAKLVLGRKDSCLLDCRL